MKVWIHGPSAKWSSEGQIVCYSTNWVRTFQVHDDSIAFPASLVCWDDGVLTNEALADDVGFVLICTTVFKDKSEPSNDYRCLLLRPTGTRIGE